MEKTDLAHIMGADKFNAIYLLNKTTIETIAGVATQYGLFTSKRQLLNDAINWAAVETQGKTKDAKIAQLTMAALIVKFAHKGLAKARIAKNEDFIKVFDKEISTIMRPAKVDSIKLCNEVVKCFVDNDTFFDNILPADIVAMNNAISAFDAIKTVTANTIDLRKIEGTDAIHLLIKEIYEIMQIIYDFVYGEFIDTNKTLVDELEASMAINVEGIRHTGLLIVCMDKNSIEKTAIQDAQVKIVEVNRTAITNILGEATIIQFRSGTYHVEISKAGYKTKKSVIYFKRGRIVKIEGEMERE